MPVNSPQIHPVLRFLKSILKFLEDQELRKILWLPRSLPRLLYKSHSIAVLTRISTNHIILQTTQAHLVYRSLQISYRRGSWDGSTPIHPAQLKGAESYPILNLSRARLASCQLRANQQVPRAKSLILPTLGQGSLIQASLYHPI